MKRLSLSFFLAVAAAGCGIQETETQTDDVQLSESDLVRGCVKQCPQCIRAPCPCTIQCPPQAPECKSDLDCRLSANCSCGCVALGPTEKPLFCNKPVACFAAPCMNKTAACVKGQCEVVPTTH
ncbi:MAG: hypothetical protein IPJ65_22870 [Archangiaceae bacterium]|nr:hypothetical protein [Archangiaceae bacterium]